MASPAIGGLTVVVVIVVVVVAVWASRGSRP